MILFFGTRFYGAVDRTREGWHVATQFFHISFIPLIPIKSMLVVAREGSQLRGFPMPIDGNSVIAAYLRVWPVVGMFIGMVISLRGGGPQHADPIAIAFGCGMTIFCLALLIWANFSSSMRRAGPSRERQLQRLAGGDRENMNDLTRGEFEGRPQKAAAAGGSKAWAVPGTPGSASYRPVCEE